MATFQCRRNSTNQSNEFRLQGPRQDFGGSLNCIPLDSTANVQEELKILFQTVDEHQKVLEKLPKKS